MFFAHNTGGLGIGHVTERRAVAFVAITITDFPTLLSEDFSFVDCLNKICNFVILLVFHLSRGMVCVHFYEFGKKVRLRRSAWHGYQWYVRKGFIKNHRFKSGFKLTR